MELYLADSILQLKHGSTFYFSICELEGMNSTIGNNCNTAILSKTVSEAMTTECAPYSIYYISVSEVDVKRDVVSTSNGRAVCMYVRRELRSLTNDDLEATMDAMYTLWTTDESAGQEKYGDKFHSSGYFSEAHTFNAAQQDSDHIHEGQGFLTQHIKITNTYEESVQAVDPSVSLFCWDYTLDLSYGLTLGLSPMFTPETFGTLTFPADPSIGWTYANDTMEDAAIPDGRWKKQKTDVNTKYPDLGNSFGYMRGPWNFYPSPYISRFSLSVTKLPSCSAYYDWLSDTSFQSFQHEAPFAPHASTHGAIGAVYGCDMFLPLLEQGLLKDTNSLLSTCKKWGFYMKEFYRSGLISIADEDDCSVDSLDYDGVSCGVVCPTDAENLDDLSASLHKQIQDSSVDKGFDDWDSWRDFLCAGDAYKVFVGDHLESASPSDPSFWPIHPNQERLMQLKFMTGGFKSEEWPSDPDDVCSKSACYEPEFGVEGNYTQCCYGHYEYDQLLDFVSGDASKGVGLTNRQDIDFADPRRDDYNMSYIYDDFSWSHCDGDFAGLVQELYDKYWKGDR